LPKLNLTKHTLFLREGDYQRIIDIYHARDIKAARVIRQLVSQFVDNIASGSGAENIIIEEEQE